MKSVRKNSALALISAAVVLVYGGCNRHTGEAIVRAKEHIPVAEFASSPSANPSSTPATDDAVAPDEQTPGAGIITEDSGPEVRGTNKDPRAVDHEQWIVSVEMVNDLRRIEVRVDQPRWEALKVGDRVKVTYKTGKYTGTVWDSEIE